MGEPTRPHRPWERGSHPWGAGRRSGSSEVERSSGRGHGLTRTVAAVFCALPLLMGTSIVAPAEAAIDGSSSDDVAAADVSLADERTEPTDEAQAGQLPQEEAGEAGLSTQSTYAPQSEGSLETGEAAPAATAPTVPVPDKPGWFRVDGTWYFTEGAGELYLGWLKWKDRWYYLEASGEMATGWLQLDDGRYYLESSGAMVTGWLKMENHWYYFKSSGRMATGWTDVKGRRYYLDPSGVMATGWLELDGQRYYLRSSGAMVTGWLKMENRWYYFKPSGAMATGWEKVNNRWYYLESSGAMATGWLKLDDRWYYLKSSGAMATGWAKVNNRWYYLKSSGAMATGWVKVKGTWYYLNKNGAMLTGTHTIDGKVSSFANSGAWLGYGYRFGMKWVAQQTNYWCGPASGYSVLAALGHSRSASGVALSQAALASNSYMKTDLYRKTSFANNMFAVGMNRWIGKSSYSQRRAPNTAFFREKVRNSFTKKLPVVVDTQEWASGAHYNNHPRVTFSHIMPVEGYNPSSDTITMIDPAAHFYYYNGSKNVFSHSLPSFTGFLQQFGIYY